MQDDQLVALQPENARLISLLGSHGIERRLPSPPTRPIAEPNPRDSPLEKRSHCSVACFGGEPVIHKVGARPGDEPDRFEVARGKADVKWRTDELMALLRDED